MDESPKWLQPYLAAALRSGIIAGYPSEDGAVFCPEQVITGSEAAVMICNALELALPYLPEGALRLVLREARKNRV